MSVRSDIRMASGTSMEHRMFSEMKAHGELPTGKHAKATIHKRYRQFKNRLNRENASMRARQVNAMLRAKKPDERTADTKVPLFQRVTNAFARMLRK